MALQKSVNLYPAAAVAGDRASMNPFIYTPQNYLAGEGGVTVGGFVWENTEKTDPMQVVSSGDGAPLGIVERILENYNYDVMSDGSLVIPAGGLVTVVLRGDILVEADVAVEVGATVYAGENGVASFSSGTETSFVAMTAGDAGDMIIISNEAATVSSGSGSDSGNQPG